MFRKLYLAWKERVKEYQLERIKTALLRERILSRLTVQHEDGLFLITCKRDDLRAYWHPLFVVTLRLTPMCSVGSAWLGNEQIHPKELYILAAIVSDALDDLDEEETEKLRLAKAKLMVAAVRKDPSQCAYGASGSGTGQDYLNAADKGQVKRREITAHRSEFAAPYGVNRIDDDFRD